MSDPALAPTDPSRAGLPLFVKTDGEIDLLISYLTHMATRRGTP